MQGIKPKLQNSTMVILVKPQSPSTKQMIINTTCSAFQPFIKEKKRICVN